MRWKEILQESGISCRVENGQIVAQIGNKEVGWFPVMDNGKTISLHANVCNLHRRLGIASAVYDWAEDHLGKKVVPYDRLSPEAYRFWQRRNPTAVSDFIRDGENYYSPSGAKKWLN